MDSANLLQVLMIPACVGPGAVTPVEVAVIVVEEEEVCLDVELEVAIAVDPVGALVVVKGVTVVPFTKATQ